MKLSKVFKNGRIDAEYEYDPEGKVKQVSYTNYNQDNQEITLVVWNYTYNATGNIINALSESKGSATNYAYNYNEKGQLADVIGTGGLEVYYIYDENGRVIEEDMRMIGSAKLRKVYKYSYSADGNVVGIYCEWRANNILQSRFKYVFTYDTDLNFQSAIPGRVLQNYLHMPGYWHSKNNLIAAELYKLSDKSKIENTVINLEHNHEGYPVKATIKSDDGYLHHLDGKVYTFEYGE